VVNSYTCTWIIWRFFFIIWEYKTNKIYMAILWHLTGHFRGYIANDQSVMILQNLMVLNSIVISLRTRYTMINQFDRHITLLGDLDISFVLYNISSKFLSHLECFLLSPKRHIKININRQKDVSVWLRRVIRLSQWFITLCLRLLYNQPKKGWCQDSNCWKLCITILLAETKYCSTMQHFG